MFSHSAHPQVLLVFLALRLGTFKELIPEKSSLNQSSESFTENDPVELWEAGV